RADPRPAAARRRTGADDGGGDLSAEPEPLSEKRELADQLAHLRSEFQEAVACYSLRVQGILAEIGDALAADDPGKLSSRELKARRRLLREAIDRAGAMKLKPAKGRRRDLKAVEALAKELRGRLV